MRKITDTLSKEIVSVCEGEIAGIVTNVYADKRLVRVRGYKVSSEDRDEGRMLPLRRLLGEGDALIIGENALLEEKTPDECPLGAKVFDTAGAFHGVLRDLCFDESTGRVLSLVADEKEIAPERVVRFGKNAVVLRAPCHDKKVFRRSARRVAPKATAPNKSEEALFPFPLLSEESAAESEPKSETPAINELETQSSIAEVFPLQDYAFLLGRRVLKRIGEGEDVVAREGEIVTAEIVLKARERGKLVELTVNSRK